MNVSPNLMYAILSMDSYNRGYNAGISGLGSIGSQIGLATVGKDSSQLLSAGEDFGAGFYAVANNYDGGTVISYRGII